MRTDEALEALIEVILEVRHYLYNTEFAPDGWVEPVDINKLRVDFPNQILNLKDAQGKPYLAVLAKDQSVPETLIDELEYGDSVCHDFRWGVHCAQQDMIKVGFVKRELEEKP